MHNYSEGYLKVTTNIYPPHIDHRKYQSGAYLLKAEYKKELITNTSDAGLILFDYYYSRMVYNYFKPNDNALIASNLGWNVKKVERVRKLLQDNDYLLILSDTAKDGAKLYRTLLGQELVKHYKEHGIIAEGANLDIQATKT